jgi:dihydroxyacetone kinase
LIRPGCERTSLELPGLVTKMLAQLLDDKDKDRAFCKISKTDQPALLINNLGGVSPLELGGITTEVSFQLESQYGVKPVRYLAGTFMTSLNGLGFSITLLKLSDGMLQLLDDTAEAVGWSANIQRDSWKLNQTSHKTEDEVPHIQPKPSNIKSKLDIRDNINPSNEI